MKNLLVSILCLMILLIPWMVYDNYSTKEIQKYTALLNEEIIPAIESENWAAAEQTYSEIENSWLEFQTISEYFLDAQAVNQIDDTINKTKYHILMQDRSNAAACSSELIHMLDYLHENELLSSGNVF